MARFVETIRTSKNRFIVFTGGECLSKNTQIIKTKVSIKTSKNEVFFNLLIFSISDTFSFPAPSGVAKNIIKKYKCKKTGIAKNIHFQKYKFGAFQGFLTVIFFYYI